MSENTALLIMQPPPVPPARQKILAGGTFKIFNHFKFVFFGVDPIKASFSCKNLAVSLPATTKP